MMECRDRKDNALRRCTVEESLKVDINQIRRTIAQLGSPICKLTWDFGATSITGIAALMGDRVIVCVQNRRFYADLRYRKPHFGGISASLACPSCAREARTLFITSRALACRTCSGLKYQSQLERRPDRARRRALKIMDRLARGHASLMTIPERPAGMHRRTYLRNVLDLASFMRLGDEALTNQALKLKNRCLVEDDLRST